MTTSEVAAELGVTDRTVRTFADRGFLPAVRLTPTSPRRFRREDVDRLLSAATAGGSAAASNGAARHPELEPAWATVAITLGASVVAVLGTLAATALQHRYARRDRKTQEQAERRRRAANVLGPVRTLLADLEPTRVGFNVNEETPKQLKAVEERWATLRDEVSVFAAGEEDPRVMDAAAKLEVGVSNTINRVGWHVHDLLAGGVRALDTYEQARQQHAEATVRVRIVLDLVRGRDVAQVEQTLKQLEAGGATGGQQEQPKTAETVEPADAQEPSTEAENPEPPKPTETENRDS